MGCMVSALCSTGTSIDRLKTVMNDSVWGQVFPRPLQLRAAQNPFLYQQNSP